MLITAGGNVQVAGCFIGTDPTGETAAPNGTGVEIENSSNTDRRAERRRSQRDLGDGRHRHNLVHDGIYVPDQANNPLNITPTGNVDREQLSSASTPRGQRRSANSYEGVEDIGSGDTYGGTTAGLGNVISGNGSAGIVFDREHHDRGELYRHGCDR